jgi:hypothetical protein
MPIHQYPNYRKKERERDGGGATANGISDPFAVVFNI